MGNRGDLDLEYLRRISALLGVAELLAVDARGPVWTCTGLRGVDYRPAATPRPDSTDVTPATDSVRPRPLLLTVYRSSRIVLM